MSESPLNIRYQKWARPPLGILTLGKELEKTQKLLLDMKYKAIMDLFKVMSIQKQHGYKQNGIFSHPTTNNVSKLLMTEHINC